MSDLLTGALTVLLATNQPAALSNLVEQTTGISVSVANPNDPVEREYQKILEADDAAQAEALKWLGEDDNFAELNSGARSPTLRSRIAQRFVPVKTQYEDFIRRHPKHVNARLAYASFLGDIKDEVGAMKQLEQALEVAPNHPALLNNLANLYGHGGPVKKAFELYERAIAQKPMESTYYYNHATTVYLFRRDAMAHYGITEQQVFDKAMKLYEKALELDPKNFVLATDVAKSYYAIKPERVADALKSWQQAYDLATTDEERQGVRVHFARWEMIGKQFEKAREQLKSVTLDRYSEAKSNILHLVQKREAEAKTNAPAAKP